MLYTDNVIKQTTNVSYYPQTTQLRTAIHMHSSLLMDSVCPAVLINIEIRHQPQNSSHLDSVTVTGTHCSRTSVNPNTDLTVAAKIELQCAVGLFPSCGTN
jgi:hypothetical protein